MDRKTLEQANALDRIIREINEELRAWEHTTSPHSLGMTLPYDRERLTKLPCKHSPKEAFDNYRQSCINALKVRKAEIEDELERL